MSDIKTTKERSYNMSQIRGKNTKPEEVVRKYLFSKGFRYRKNDSRYPGSPDIVLARYRTMVFVNGCFWHKHEGCKYFVWPKSNEDFWKAKIERNVARDKQVYEQLSQLGWNIIVVWECEIRTRTKQAVRLPALAKEIIDNRYLVTAGKMSGDNRSGNNTL